MGDKRLNKRDSAIEFIRFIAMFMIVSCHVVSKFREYCNIDAASLTGRLSDTLLNWWGGVGVMLFIIISSWFMTEKTFDIRRIINILLEAIVIRLLFFIGELVYLFTTTGVVQTIKSVTLYEVDEILLPLWSDDWYVTVYIVFLLIMPYLNWILHNVAPNKIRNGLIIFGFIPFFLNFVSAGLVMGGIIYFPYIYILVGYLKLYKKENFFSKYSFFKFLIIAIVYLCTKFLLPIIPQDGPVGYIHRILSVTVGNDRGFCFIVGIMSFCLFYSLLKIGPKNSGFARFLGKYAFAVYLVHGNQTHLKLTGHNKFEYLWSLLLPFTTGASPIKFLVIQIIMVIAIYLISLIGGIFIENVLYSPLKKGILKKYNEKIDRFNKWYNKLI